MKIVEASAELLAYSQLVPSKRSEDVAVSGSDPCGDVARIIERCGRVSWKSEAKMVRGSADDFITRVVNIRKDESIAEHASATVLFVTDRYASHQLVRHRIAAYTQESTHYINYGKGDKETRELGFCRPLGIPQQLDVPCQRCANLKAMPSHIQQVAAGAEEHLSHCTGFNKESNPAFEKWEDICRQGEEYYFDLIDSGVKHYHARFVLPGSLKTEIAVTFNMRMWRHFFTMRCTANNTPEIVLMAKQGLAILNELCPPMFEDQYKQFIGGAK